MAHTLVGHELFRRRIFQVRREPAAGVEIGEDQRRDEVAVGSGDHHVFHVRRAVRDEGDAQRPDVNPRAGRELEVLGDALRFDDPARPETGLLFEGRIAEDFKLATGTWVHVGALRVSFIAHCAPYVRDVVIAGADRDYLGALIFPDLDACRRLAPDLKDATPEELVAHESVRREFRHLLDSFAKAATGSSNRIARAILLETPPSLDIGEATDKGSINQRMVLQNRAALVDELYADQPSSRVLTADER